MFGIFQVKPETLEYRMSVCNDCEHFEKERKKCKQCGCYMEYKAQITTMSCPLKKWGAEKNDEQPVNQ